MQFKNEPPEQRQIKQPCESVWQRKWLRLDCHCPQIQQLATTTEKFCGRWFRNERNGTLLVLAGNTGVGKTHVASCVYTFSCKLAMTAYERGAWGNARIPSSSYIHFPELVDRVREGKLEGFTQLCGHDLVVLDDIGAEQDPFKQGADKLCQLLTKREGKFTLVTTNVVPAQWPQKWDLRIADRLMRDSVIVDLFNVPSYSLI